jgi:hypothetical protein
MVSVSETVTSSFRIAIEDIVGHPEWPEDSDPNSQEDIEAFLTEDPDLDLIADGCGDSNFDGAEDREVFEVKFYDSQNKQAV